VFLNAGRRSFDLLWVRDISSENHCPASGRFHIPARSFEAIKSTGEQTQASSAFRELNSGRPAYPSGSSGYDYDFVFPAHLNLSNFLESLPAAAVAEDNSQQRWASI
jgi:hypothetical protein